MSQTFADILERLWTEQHTGPVIIHFGQGCPNEVEIPSPPTRIHVDRPARKVCNT
jgi:hypothetical protein